MSHPFGILQPVWWGRGTGKWNFDEVLAFANGILCQTYTVKRWRSDSISGF